MHRAQLLKLLTDYQPTLEESTFKENIISFIHDNHHCFERSLEIGHITASAWLLNKEKTHALIMHHAKLNKWVQLGGHCDGNSNVLDVAIKEAQEESGISAIEPIKESIFDVDIHLIPANSREKEHYHYDIRFLLGVKSNEDFIQNHESKELRWIDKDHRELLIDNRSVERMFYKWLNLDY